MHNTRCRCATGPSSWPARGLLDGLRATTTASNLERLKTEFPKTHIVYDQRYVDNGKIITTGGLSAGIDGALHVVEEMRGRGTAQHVALSEEYDWQAQSRFARAALADQVIPDLRDEDLETSGDWQILHTEGDRDRWDIAFQGPSKLSARELFAKISGVLVTRGNWIRADAASSTSSPPLTGHWKIVGRDRREREGTMSVTAGSDAGNHYLVQIHIARAR